MESAPTWVAPWLRFPAVRPARPGLPARPAAPITAVPARPAAVSAAPGPEGPDPAAVPVPGAEHARADSVRAVVPHAAAAQDAAVN